ncbi:MAG: hypothetical protein ABSA70_09285 [Terriglobia bacterium]
MQGLAGLTAILALVWLVAGLIFFLMVLSIAIDAARLVRRCNRIIELLQKRV